MWDVLIAIFLAAINLPFLIDKPDRWWNAISFGYCLGMGMAMLIEEIAEWRYRSKY